ncbi:putative glycosyl transferase [Thermincola ferriacetica]|uniref:4,4'-diaponeurosporenoate glycosyltransferase n=1 Tax=Thermincola ferriacetica TaxID=281456 RepID=A0A0L6W3B9_9FIRM|nr:glycosyltransferase [Thermincola ferriacetica]KNZ70030.1 putative glycosyl transferase [Thermincola ferriacetica]
MKYEFKIDMSNDSAHSLVLRHIRFGSQVLEFGPATGYMTRYMKEKLGCIVYCVERDIEAARKAANYCDRMIIADIESMDWIDPLSEKSFDHIVFADVLEHLRDPWKVLEYAKAFLKQGGTVVTSIPNIGHSAVLMELFQGRFEYQPLGILDETHMRFFTKKSVLDLLEKAGLCPIKWLGTIAYPEDTEFKQEYRKFPPALQTILKNREDAHVYQFVTVSKRKEDICQTECCMNFNSLSHANNGYVQVFWKLDGRFDENISAKVPLECNKGFVKYELNLPPKIHGCLRVDPASFPAYGEIKNIALFSNNVHITGELEPVLFWSKENNFEGLSPGPGVVFLDGQDTKKFLCIDFDPQLYLTNVPDIGSDHSLVLRIEMSISENIPQNISAHINELFSENDRLWKELKKKNEQLKTQSNELARTQEELKNKNKQIQHQLEKLEKQDMLLKEKEKCLRGLQIELTQIYNSNGWKALSLYYKTIDKLLPDGTKRRNYLFALKNNIRKSASYLKLYGLKSFIKKVKYKLNSTSVKLDGKNTFDVPQLKLVRVPEKKIEPTDDATVSIIIPTKNAGEDFDLLLAMLQKQKGFKNVEIIIVDSGSTDGTLETAKDYKTKIVTILPEQFSHSYARNLGASHATGNFLLFTTQDAFPPSDLWLYELFCVLKNNEVVAVSCAETPREDADLFYRVIAWNHYKFLEVDKNDRVFCKPEAENYMTLRKNGQLSDIACLISKDIFMKYKYRFNYAEDLDLGIRLIKHGHKIAFLGSTRIIHSHNRPPYYFLKRGYVDNLFLSDIFSDFPIPFIEVNSFIKDIVFTYNILNSVIKSELLNLKLPLKIDEFISIVNNKFQIANRCSYPASIDIDGNEYIDNEFKSFLTRIWYHYSGHRNHESYNGILIDALLGFLDITFQYIRNTYELIDDYVLEDFKSCIFKEYAILCGAHLAYCYLKSPDKEKDALHDIYSELIKGV